MRTLLDTHAFLWWISDSRRLSASARRVIEDETNTILVSAASAWEITTKHRIGKLAHVEAVALDVTGTIAGQGFEELAITVDDAARAGRLPGLHRDPFDRVLIAQALARDMAIVSVDQALDGYGVRRLW
ncbi:MAG: type II toxin-antitoxin system VapC family toxin [Chromatiales bacterium]|nr:type II toxin-antitoxin system VapC family toxin [Chromatiales bacterium]